jgi:hypothetical protein
LLIERAGERNRVGGNEDAGLLVNQIRPDRKPLSALDLCEGKTITDHDQIVELADSPRALLGERAVTLLFAVVQNDRQSQSSVIVVVENTA